MADESDDVYVKGMLDRYVKRPQNMANVCLADFASNFNFFKRSTRNSRRHEGAEDEETHPDEGAESEDSANQRSTSDEEGDSRGPVKLASKFIL